jgi:prefoldin subunit 5|tara:strand:- start:122 stop:238 length:117 start_codon:yes stop_codon:yes gene_type:complete
MSSIGYKSTDEEINKLIARLQQIISDLESRIKKLEQGS